METAALVVPITGLEFLQDKFLLTGEGPVLSVFSLQTLPKASVSLSVLQHHRIHGIRPRNQAAVPTQSSSTVTHRHDRSSISKPYFHDLAVFGGKAVRVVRLHVDVEHLRLETQGPLLELRDWALDARWSSGDNRSLLCVAVAHNGALLLDAVSGNVLVHCSCFEGCLLYSALLLVHESWADTVLVGGTVFNQLVIWKPGGCNEMSDSGFKAPVERRLSGHSGVIFSISYLQEKGQLASASDDRSVRVWGIGTIGGPGGNCGELNPTCLRVLYGHQARVFSVRLTPERVFSAGEDGTCLVWDLAGGGKVVRTLKGHRAGGIRALAVSDLTGDGKRWVVTGGADGGVRLWKVEDRERDKEDVNETVEKITDLKLPNHVPTKVVCVAGGKDGNTSWCQFVVCTDRGIICQYKGGKWETLWQGPPEFHSYCVIDAISVVIESATTVDLCSVGNLGGSLQVLPTSHPESGIRLTGGSGKIHSVIWQKHKDDVYLLASGAEGLVYRWRVDVKTKKNSFLDVSATSLPPFLLPKCAKRWLTAATLLQRSPETLLWVCGDRRGSLLLFKEGANTERGERDEGRVDDEQGEVDGESRATELQPLSCLFGAHGKGGVTSVCEHRGLLYSSGKDGCVRVFRVNRAPESPGESRRDDSSQNEKLQLEVLRVQRACKGMEWLERVLFLESEFLLEEEKCEDQWVAEDGEQIFIEDAKEREARFVIAGFHAAHFVIWDPVRQERLMSVPCGGGHRSWSLWTSHAGIWPGYGALVFIKQGAVLTWQPPGETLGGAEKEGETAGWSLRDSIHGRGIWCVCRLGRIEEFGDDVRTKRDKSDSENEGCEVGGEKRCWEIVVTGGEDTSLAVLALNPLSGLVRVLSVLTDHISGVRTVTAITRPEGGRKQQKHTLSALLLSAGGRAQIQCYRLVILWDRQRRAPSCQVVQVASHRLDIQWERRRNRHKTVKMNPETRYVSIEVLEERVDCVLFALSCSDGAVRLFSVSEVKNRIDLLWEIFYHQRCVLSVATCSLEDDEGNRSKLLFSAATDGKIAVWHLTQAQFSSMDNSSGAPTAPIPGLDIPAHQSGVNSLAVWAEKLGRREGCLVTVASGGDDGQLTVSTVRVWYPEDGKLGGSRGFSQICHRRALPQAHVEPSDQIQLQLLSQSHVLLAHAGPLTALKLLSPGLLVSTSSDQRVCLWRVGRTGISHSGALFSHVADAAGLAVWEGGEGDETGTTGFETERVNAGYEGNVDPVCDRKGCETTETDEKTGSVVSCGSREKRQKMGWVLVCGQGFQLLRLRFSEMDTENIRKENGFQKQPPENQEFLFSKGHV
ncbi:tRNA (34-2'-O)-methyltransferase regulator WDR6 [Austrofundulus limnaeus]|uniref:tRNA (34-2'-O)-methyltransferase regulator WDR6 n=1 Tax=Austrofundulus limnaeus TaxID=52670 RepID=A0A2I4AP11_AUSLI|nr:PREDICTED: WD repeat-containing protein 6 [Austrofundulus limnaeus]